MPDIVAIGRAFFLEAPEASRTTALQLCLDALHRQWGGTVWTLSCDFREGGIWAGANRLFASLLPALQRDRPDLVEKHSYELACILPTLKRRWTLTNPTLTDLASPEERVRNYPADRSHRIVHGLIDLLTEWKGDDRSPWLIGCDRYGVAGATVRRFFRELLRRRGERLGIVLVLGVDLGAASELRQSFENASRGPVFRFDVAQSPKEPPPASRQQLEATARILEEEVRQDRRTVESHVAELIDLWRKIGRPDKVAHWEYQALDTYDWLGFYEEAIEYGESLRSHLKASGCTDPSLLWRVFLKLFMSYAALQQPEAAYRLAQEDVIGRKLPSKESAQLSYLLSMLHARFLPARDLKLGETHLDQGLNELRRAELTPEEFHFQSVFNRNGLAMIRHFQGRFEEAIALCREGYEELEAHLSPDRHRLHRSVLLFNLAQVYGAIGETAESIRHFTSALEMDPNYSEYYNDRGSVYLRVGELEAACADYLRAIELSPPYPEVYVNLGQCYRSQGELEKAVEAYGRALDLDPHRSLARVGRGQCYEAQGRIEDAVADYDAALQIDPNQWDVLASRAVLAYERGSQASALADLNAAIELAPDIPDLYQNRSFVLTNLGRIQEARQDLERCLLLAPEAEDVSTVSARLVELQFLDRAQAASP